MRQEFELIQHSGTAPLKTFLVHVYNRNPHWHSDLELDLVLAGSIAVKTPNQIYTLSSGDLLLLNGDTPHEISKLTQDNTILALQVSPKLFSGYFPALARTEFDASFLNPICESEALTSVKALLIAIAYQAAVSPAADSLHQLKAVSLLNLLILTLLLQVPHHSVSEEERSREKNRIRRLSRIADYIEEHCSEKLLLSELAEMEGLCLTYLSHFFKDNLHITFQQYLNNVRFEHAVPLITQTDKSLLDITIECGFSDSRYLNRMFSKEFGCSPKDYRKHSLTPSPEICLKGDPVQEQFVDQDTALAILIELYREHRVFLGNFLADSL